MELVFPKMEDIQKVGMGNVPKTAARDIQERVEVGTVPKTAARDIQEGVEVGTDRKAATWDIQEGVEAYNPLEVLAGHMEVAWVDSYMN